MIDESKYIQEMQAGIRAAFDTMAAIHPDVVIYSISIWTDEKAKKSAVSFDTFENSEAKCRSANEALQKMRDEFGSAGIDFKVPPDMKRNDNPADFEFRKVAVIYNTSLDAQLHFDQDR